MRSRQFRPQHYGRGVVYMLNVQREKRAFRTAFDFLIERMNAPDSPGFWQETTQKAADAAFASGNDDLTMNLLCAAFEHLEQRKGVK